MTNVRHYIAVEWIHNAPNQPVLLYSELDEERWETRKAEVFRDGKADFADENFHSGNIFLSDSPIPPLEEIAKNPVFKPRSITAEEFEAVWREAQANASPKRVL